ncbi:MAG: hypothetical protein RLZZ200_255 [Pseudomonadota bacterium]
MPEIDLNLLPTGPAPEQPAQQPDASAPPADDASTTPAESKPTEPSPDAEARKALKGVQKRIDELTKARYQAEEQGRQQAEYWREQALRAAQELEAQKRATAAPRFEQFAGNMDEYTAAVARHEAEKIAAETAARERQFYATEQQRAFQAQQQQAAEANYQRLVESKIQEAVKKYTDFVDVVTAPELPPIRNTPAFSAILDSEKGAEIMYFLGKNPARAHQIVSLSPVGQVREIGRIEASLAAGTAVSSAPPPPEAVGGTKGGGPKDPAKMSYSEFVEWRRRSEARRR